MQCCNMAVHIDGLLHVTPQATDSSVIMILASVIIKANNELFDNLNREIGEHCFTFEWNVLMDDETMSFNKARYAHVRLHDRCPDTEHHCKHTEKPSFSQLWKEEPER